ncbi:MAG: hypothetical protein AAF722_13600, partial [Cyanobacteria bacterium P01_C01_bin.70]
MLSPWFVRVQFGLVIALPAAVGVGLAESAKALEAPSSEPMAKASLAKPSAIERSRLPEPAITASPQVTIEVAAVPLSEPGLERSSLNHLNSIAASGPLAPVMPSSESGAHVPTSTPEAQTLAPADSSQ